MMLINAHTIMAKTLLFSAVGVFVVNGCFVEVVIIVAFVNADVLYVFVVIVVIVVPGILVVVVVEVVVVVIIKVFIVVL